MRSDVSHLYQGGSLELGDPVFVPIAITGTCSSVARGGRQVGGKGPGRGRTRSG